VSGVVVFASRRALDEAERLQLPGVLENQVEAANLDGRKKRRSAQCVTTLHPGEAIVFLRHDVAAVIAKNGKTSSGRRRWRVRRLVRVQKPGNRKEISHADQATA
jgi:hypothetical protein